MLSLKTTDTLKEKTKGMKSLVQCSGDTLAPLVTSLSGSSQLKTCSDLMLAAILLLFKFKFLLLRLPVCTALNGSVHSFEQ